MEKYKSKIITDRDIWEKFVLSGSPKSFLQSWDWGLVNEDCGNRVLRFGFYCEGVLCGVSQFIEQDAKRGKHYIVPGGPILVWTDRKMVSKFIETSRNLCLENGALFVRIRPEVYDSDAGRMMFSRLGFITSPMHLNAQNTWILDISKEEKDLFAGMRKSTRYLVKKGLSESGIRIEKTVDAKKVRILSDLQDITVKRHGFVGFSQKYFESQVERFGVCGNASFYVAYYNNKPQVAAIILYYGNTAYYHHAASSSEFKKIPIAYRLQWEIIKDAKKRGLGYYNFWGVSPNDDPHHRFYGVTLFKKGFGGEQIDWIPAKDIVFSGKYILTYVFEQIRKIFRRL